MPKFIPVMTLYEEVSWAEVAVKECKRIHHSAEYCDRCVVRKAQLENPANYVEINTDLTAIGIDMAKTERLIQRGTDGHSH